MEIKPFDVGAILEQAEGKCYSGPRIGWGLRVCVKTPLRVKRLLMSREKCNLFPEPSCG
jgi:hypothetical protein